MEISSITNAVGDLWDFLWPRFTVLGIFIGATWFVAAASLRQVFAGLSRKMDPRRLRRILLWLRAYNVTSLAPLAALFLSLFTLFAAAAILDVIGDALPPAITTIPDRKLASILDENEWLCLARNYPMNNGLYGLVEFAEMRTGAVGDAAKNRPRYWDERSGEWQRRINVSKALALWLVLVAVGHIYRSGQLIRTAARLGAALALCLLAASLSTGMYLYSQEQQLHTRAGVLRFIAAGSTGTSGCVGMTAVTPPATAEETARLDGMREGPWWQLEFQPVNYWTWMLNEFFERKPQSH